MGSETGRCHRTLKLHRHAVDIGNCIYYNCCSVAQSCLTLCDPMDFSLPGFPVLHHLLEIAKTHVHWLSDVIQSSLPLLSPSRAFNFSGIRVFSNESTFHIRWPKYWASALASVLPMNIQDWFPLGLTGLISLKPKGHSRVLPQYHSSKASILQHSAFFMVLLYIHTWLQEKNIALTRWTFVSKVISLLFNTLSRFV